MLAGARWSPGTIGALSLLLYFMEGIQQVIAKAAVTAKG